MSIRCLTLCLTTAGFLGAAAGATASAADANADAGVKAPPKWERATFGGGCFWCMEAVFEHIPGVRNVVSGFSGGTVPYPTYEMVCTGFTGHAEVVQVEFDPAVVSYEKLVRLFWKEHDPTTPNQQGDDVGTQYRSIIIYHNEAQKLVAQQVHRDLIAHKVYRRPIVTELMPFKAFYPADMYHQDYYRNHRGNDYSTIYIEPKLRKLRQTLQPPKSSKAKTSAKANAPTETTSAAAPAASAEKP